MANKLTFAQAQQMFAPSKGTKAFNYNYSNLPVILEELKKLEIEYSLMLSNSVLLKQEKLESTTQAGKTKIEYCVTIETEWLFQYLNPVDKDAKKDTDISRNTEIFRNVTMISSGTQSDYDKAFGTAYTYARRYALLSIFNANDGGNYDPEQKDPEQKEETKPISKPENIVETKPKNKKVILEKTQATESTEKPFKGLNFDEIEF